MINGQEISKKSEELAFIESFLKVTGWPAEIVDKDRESPDFLIKLDGKSIGVEITKIFISSGPDNLQARESRGARIISKAQQNYRAMGGEPVDVKVIFHPGYNVFDLPIDVTAAALSSLVKETNLELWQEVTFKYADLEKYLPKEISYVRVLRVLEEAMGHWGVPSAGWVASLSDVILQERIDAKAGLLSGYEHADEQWLLLVSNVMKPSQMFKDFENLDKRKIQSPFSRTFFYPYPENAFYEL